MAEAFYSPCRFVKISLYSVSVFCTTHMPKQLGRKYLHSSILQIPGESTLKRNFQLIQQREGHPQNSRPVPIQQQGRQGQRQASSKQGWPGPYQPPHPGPSRQQQQISRPPQPIEDIPEEISKDLKSEDYSDSGSDDEHADQRPSSKAQKPEEVTLREIIATTAPQ
uniref:Uncharacterized protein n=1 Tax=Magallana gigas TaxID=29159 RepID=K1PNJ0_MAGGI